MVKGLDDTKAKKKKHVGLIKDKDYITEAWLQGGKAVGEAIRPKIRRKNKAQ